MTMLSIESRGGQSTTEVLDESATEFNISNLRVHGYVDIDGAKPAEQVSHAPTTCVANISKKKGFPQDKDKVEGKANKLADI